MDDAVAVCVVEGGQRARGDLQRPLGQQSTPARQQLAQRHAVDELHHDVGHDDASTVVGLQGVLAGVVDGDDVGVVQRGGRLGLTAKARLEGRVAGEVGAQDLDRDPAPQAQVACLVDLGHAPAADDLADLVAIAEHASFTHVGLQPVRDPIISGSPG